MDYILLIVGFALLIKGADVFVDGASSLAKKIGIPPVIVGLTIVSLGTSAPELAVSLISSLNGTNDIAIGNVVGSNIFNTLMVLGTTAIVLPLTIQKQKIKLDFLVNISVSIVLFALTFDSLLGKGQNLISRIDGVILLVICIIYISYLIFKSVKRNINPPSAKDKNINVYVKISLMILGTSAIVLGGDFVVDSATNIAYKFGMSEKLVGLTIVAMGTSLPELVTSIVAALKGENDIALGNVLGSNIFNILLIIGLSSVISPIFIASSLMIDFAYLIAITFFIFALIFIGKNSEKKLSRFEGAILVLLYIGYMAYIIIRN